MARKICPGDVRLSNVPCPPRHSRKVPGKDRLTHGAAPKSSAMLITEPMGFSGKKGHTVPKKGQPLNTGDGWAATASRTQHPDCACSPGVVGGRARSRHYPHAGGMLCSYVPFHQNNPSSRVPAKPQENYSQESLSQ